MLMAHTIFIVRRHYTWQSVERSERGRDLNICQHRTNDNISLTALTGARNNHIAIAKVSMHFTISLRKRQHSQKKIGETCFCFHNARMVPRHFYFLITVCQLLDRKNLPCRRIEFYNCLIRTAYAEYTASKTIAKIKTDKDVPSAFAILPESTEDST